MSSLTFVVDDRSAGGTGIPLVQIQITELADGKLAFTVTQLDFAGAYLGDLRGLFFDLANETLVGTLSVTGAPAMFTELRQGNDTIVDLGQGANMQGLLGSDGGYDVGIEIGTSGIGKDDVRSFSFTLSSSAAPLSLGDFANVDFGVRLTSIGQDLDGNGTIDTARIDSAKIGETTDPASGGDNEATGTLMVTGTPAEGGSLTASLTDVVDADGATNTAYRWQELVSGVWTDIAGQNLATLSIPDDQSFVGKEVRAVATTTDALGGTTEFVGAGQVIANTDDEATGTLAVTGTPAEGGSLTASLTDVVDADGATNTAYRWQELVSGAWTDIAGQNLATLSIPDDQSFVGKEVRAVATTTDALGGTTEFVGAGQSIANTDDEATGTLAVTGTPAEGGSLTASLTDVVDADGATNTAYRWQELVSGAWTDIAGQNLATLSIPDDQSFVGKEVRAVATTTDALGGTTEFVGAAQTIVNVNDAPAAGTVDLGTIAEDTQRIIAAAELLAGVSDVDGPAATITTLTIQTGGGALVDNLDGTWTYTPAADDDTAVTFAYTASDGEHAANGTASLDLTPVNDAPAAGTVDLGAIAEDTQRIIAAAELLAGVSDVDGPAATITTLTIQTGGGALVDNLDGTWTYTPAADDDTAVTFAYTASDGEHAANGTASLGLTPVNDDPVITAPDGGGPAAIVVAENTTVVADVDATDPDAGDTLTYAILATDGTDHDRFTINSSGILSFVAPPDFEAPSDIGGVVGDNVYVVDVQVADAHGGFDTQTITVSVTNLNEAPTARNDLIITTDTTEVPFHEWVLLFNDYDPEGDPLDAVNIGNASGFAFIFPPALPANTIAVHDNSAPFTYGTFTYQASDGTTAGNVATVSVSVGSVGTAADEILIGNNAGPDNLTAGGGNDILIGQGLSLDTLQGGEGDDVYVFQNIDLNLGPENVDTGDTIIDTSGTDTIAIASLGGALIGDGNLAVWRAVDNLALGYANNNTFSSLVVTGHFALQPVEYIHFIGGATLQVHNFVLADTPYRLRTAADPAPAGNDFFVGADTPEALEGGVDNDVLYGNAGNDTLTGGAGDDLLRGGVGDDTYIFDLADGHDVLSEVDGGNDLIIINANGLAFTQFEFARVDGDGAGGDPLANDLLMRFEGQSILMGSSQTVMPDRIQFAGGASLHGYDLGAGVYTFGNTGNAGDDMRIGTDGNDAMNVDGTAVNGGAGDDVVFGLGGNDTLYSGPGSDLLVGGTGDDTYIIDGVSDGVDTVFDESGAADRILFDGNLVSNALNLDRIGDNLLVSSGAGQQMTVLGQFAGSGNSVERLQFVNSSGNANVYGYLLPTTLFLIDSDLAGDTTQDIIVSDAGADSLTGAAAIDFLFGNGGNDTLNGGIGNDLLVGGSDDDVYQFAGADGDDIVFDSGGATDQIVFTDVGAETLTALNVERVVNGLAVTLNGSTITVFNQFAGAAIEQATFADGAAVYGYALSASPYAIGTDAATPLDGTGGQDIIASSTTTGDVLDGLGGNDLLFGNGSNDTLKGGAGDDLLAGGAGVDRYDIALGDGDDTIFDAAGFVTFAFFGDLINFTEPTNETPSALGFERIGDDLVVTYADQTITVHRHYAGNQVEQLAFAGGATLHGYALTSTYSISFDNASPLDGFNTTVASLVASSSAGETLNGFGFGDLLFGNGGNDTLSGAGGNDLLVGGGENDVLVGGAQADSLVGGDGDDVYSAAFDGDGFDTINETGASGFDRISIATASAATSFAGFNIERLDIDSDTLLDDLRMTFNGEQIDVVNQFDGGTVEELVFTNGGTVLGYSLGTDAYAISTDITSPLGGASVRNIIASASGADALTGGSGNDLLFGNGQNDTLAGGAGNDLLAGGAGDDTYALAFSGDGVDTVNDTGGTDTIVIAADGAAMTALNFERVGNALVIAYNGEQATVANHFVQIVESVTFSGGATFLGHALGSAPRALAGGLIGGAGADVIASTNAGEILTGNAGDDLLFGNDGADSLNGNDGIDLLVGGAGNDSLSGGNDADALVGGAGIDTLTGGAGDDRHVYTAASDSTLSAMDVITGFTAGGSDDEIDLDAFDFSGAAAAAIKETAPAAFTAADTLDFFDDAGTDRAVVAEYSGGNAQVYVDANQDGHFTAAADLVIRLNAIAPNALSTSDVSYG